MPHHLKVHWQQAILAAGFILLAGIPGCRFSYELVDDSESAGPNIGLGGAPGDGDGDAGGDGDGTGDGNGSGGDAAGGDGSGGNGSGGTSTGGDGSGGDGSGGTSTGETMGDYHVTSSAGDASAGTLREAVDQALASGTAKTITFDPNLTIVMDAVLPDFTSSIELIGDGTHLDFSSVSGNPNCLSISSGTLVLDGIEISDCPDEPVILGGGSDHRILDCHIHDNGGSLTTTSASSGTIIGPGNLLERSGTHALNINAGGDIIVDNRIVDSGGYAIFFGAASDGSRAIGNLMLRTGATAISFSTDAANIDVLFNTIVSPSGSAISVGQASGIEVRNNILSYTAQYGLNGVDANIESLQYNLFFQNTLGICNGCTPGTGSQLDTDPLFTNFAADDFFPQEGSPVIDQGIDIGIDRNGARAGNYDGTTVDVGCYETNY